jgi:hypothetical protein
MIPIVNVTCMFLLDLSIVNFTNFRSILHIYHLQNKWDQHYHTRGPSIHIQLYTLRNLFRIPKLLKVTIILDNLPHRKIPWTSVVFRPFALRPCDPPLCTLRPCDLSPPDLRPCECSIIWRTSKMIQKKSSNYYGIDWLCPSVFIGL